LAAIGGHARRRRPRRFGFTRRHAQQQQPVSNLDRVLGARDEVQPLSDTRYDGQERDQGQGDRFLERRRDHKTLFP
jgi:hypothetical protein